MIDLAQNRLLVIHQNGRRYAVTIARISEAEWLEIFFDAIAFSLGKGRCASNSESLNATRAAGVRLFEGTAIACEGYPHLEGVPDWQTKIPPSHKLAFGDALFETLVLRDDRSPRCLPDQKRVICLQSLWSAGGTGAMCKHRHLTHYFKAPSGRQRQQIDNAYGALRRMSGFSRRGETVLLRPLQLFPARSLISAYNELIIRVDGYVLDGKPLTSDRAEIVLNMDAFHKVMAVRPVFSWAPAQIKERMVM